MATLILRLDIDPTTKKKNVWVKYESDSDSLPIEHEEQHKKLVEMLLADGTIKPDELGTIRIDREGQGAASPESPQSHPSEREAVATKK